jgi:sugar lactone lactonase YvrE
MIFFGVGKAYAQDMPSGGANAALLATGLERGTGSTIGPDGALYVTDGAAGRIARVDPQTGERTTFADGLPKSISRVGGVMDVAFIGETAYALVTHVSDVVGIYRVDGPDSFTVVADIGEFAAQNVPTNTDIGIPSGVQYAMEPYGDGFLVTDGHHNRVLEVTLDGEVTELVTFDNVVPTRLALSEDTVYMAEAGPVPHMPEHGKVVSFGVDSPTVTDVASGARLLVDVEFGPDGRLFALAHGDWAGGEHGTPAVPNTGKLVEVNEDGAFTDIADGLNQPTSLEFIDNTAYVVTHGGEIWKVDLQGICTLSTVTGTYIFQAQGVVVEDGEVLPYAEAGIWTLDGEGNAAGFISASKNGEAFARGDAFTATYEIASGCVYTVTDEFGFILELYSTPSGETMTYFSPGFSGIQFRW